MARQIRIVDVFTDRALTGNQLAVVLDGDGLTDEAMQRIAREMNFSETTFVLPPDDGISQARVRIFTPAFELPFAGHPTIGTAWVLVDEGMVPGGTLEFALQERVGPIQVRGEIEGDRLVFWMRHPQVTFGDTRDHAQVAAALGLRPEDLLTGVPAQFASTGVQFLYVALRDAAAVDRATSNRERLQLLTDDPHFGVFLFAVTGADRLYSRMFSLDTPEDPATGSASGPLGAIAVKYGLVARSPRVSLVSEQGTKMGRQSFIRIVLEYSDGGDIPSLIEVGGGVAPVVRGQLADLT